MHANDLTRNKGLAENHYANNDRHSSLRQKAAHTEDRIPQQIVHKQLQNAGDNQHNAHPVRQNARDVRAVYHAAYARRHQQNG